MAPSVNPPGVSSEVSNVHHLPRETRGVHWTTKLVFVEYLLQCWSFCQQRRWRVGLHMQWAFFMGTLVAWACVSRYVPSSFVWLLQSFTPLIASGGLRNIADKLMAEKSNEHHARLKTMFSHMLFQRFAWGLSVCLFFVYYALLSQSRDTQCFKLSLLLIFSPWVLGHSIIRPGMPQGGCCIVQCSKIPTDFIAEYTAWSQYDPHGTYAV